MKSLEHTRYFLGDRGYIKYVKGLKGKIMTNQELKELKALGQKHNVSVSDPYRGNIVRMYSKHHQVSSGTSPHKIAEKFIKEYSS